MFPRLLGRSTGRSREETQMPDVETHLIEAARRYLKDHYGEDTGSMDVTDNGVLEG
jgi:hypothetical protein